MSEKASRILLGIEAIVFCLPLTLLFAVYALPSVYYFSQQQPLFADLAASALVLLALGTAWFLMLTFVLRGRVALRTLSKYWWLLPVLAACLVVASLIRTASVTVLEPHWFNLFGWGLPFLVPLAHLFVERLRAVTAQSPSKTQKAQ